MKLSVPTLQFSALQPEPTTEVKAQAVSFITVGRASSSHQRRAFWSPESHYVLRIIINFLSLKCF